jgi:hypothetical protein
MPDSAFTTTARRQFLTSLPHPGIDLAHPDEERGYWIRVHCRAMACRFEIVLAAAVVGSRPAAMLLPWGSAPTASWQM